MKTSPLLGILLAVGLVASVSAQTDPGPVDLTNRESARTWFNANWAKTVNVPMGFTGNVAAGNAGDVSFAYKQATILRVNIMRRMAGMNPVNLSLDGSVKAQLAAMVDSANTDRILAGASMHSPQPDWQFYSAAAANGAAESLMTLGTVGPSTVIGFMFDPGDANASVGHRTELLMPDLLNMGCGFVPKTDPYWSGTAIWTDNSNINYNAAYAAPAVRWPAPGYVPHLLIPGRWSLTPADFLSLDQLNYGKVAVSVTKNGIAQNVRISPMGTMGLVFTLDGTSEGHTGFVHTDLGEDTFLSPVNETNDVIYHVRITNVRADHEEYGPPVNGVSLPIVHDPDTLPLYNGTGIIEYEVIGYNPAIADPNATSNARLVNISTRSFVGSGDDVQIAGFVITGSSPKSVLVRANGPSLTALGVSGALADPSIELHDANHGNSIIATNDDWSTDSAKASAIEAAANRTGAFAWSRNTKDAAVLITLNPGVYTAIVRGANSGTGVALIEVYDADASPTDSKLVNISTRSQAKTGDNVQIAGLVISGTQPKTVLIRANGPSLTALGVGGAMADPSIELHKASATIATNDNWSADSQSADQIDAAAAKVGAFKWTRGSKDAALLVTLDPGVYSTVVNGVSGSGVAMIEVYEVQ